jgi:hypothetical protein
LRSLAHRFHLESLTQGSTPGHHKCVYVRISYQGLAVPATGPPFGQRRRPRSDVGRGRGGACVPRCLPGRPSGAWMPRGRHRSEASDVDTGQLVGRLLKDIAVVMRLDEFAPVGGRSPGRRDGRRLERFAEVCENLTSRGRSHPGLGPLANLRFEVSRLLPAVFSEPEVTATVRALEGKLLGPPRHELRPGNPRGVVGAWLVTRIWVVASFRGMTVAPMPAASRLAPDEGDIGRFRDPTDTPRQFPQLSGRISAGPS